jgi:succinate dehydrogenase flavin-adding protein (antitoxin of CptAB toxin-antitoxin module)
MEWIMGRSAITEDRFVPVIKEIRRFHGIGA